MARNRRTIFVKGLGNLQVREIDPSSAAEFTDVGYLGGTTVADVYNMIPVSDETGKMVDMQSAGRDVKVKTSLLQTNKAQLDILQGAVSKYHVVRYFGQATGTKKFQYYVFPVARVIPTIEMDYKVGLRTLPVTIQTLDDVEQTFDIDPYFLAEVDGIFHAQNIVLYIDPRQGKNSETAKVLDYSGFGYHGTLNSDYAAIWQQTTTPAEFLRFDGVNDQVDLGDVLDDDATASFVIEAWVRVQGANASLQEILAKKTATGNSAGFGLWRNASNQIQFQLGSGSAVATVTTTSTVLQNVWSHVLVTVKRDGNAQIYLNGSADGSAVAVSAITTGANALSLYLGRDNTNFGQVDLGAVRIHRWNDGSLPADITSYASHHYNAEKGFYGL